MSHAGLSHYKIWLGENVNNEPRLNENLVSMRRVFIQDWLMSDVQLVLMGQP